jgi:L-amino acid N-acyltransferase YncA
MSTPTAAASGPARVRAATLEDAAGVAAIYNHYITATVATFEESPVGAAEMRDRMAVVLAALPWLVADADGAIAGYAYASVWRARSAYRYSVETTIYLDPSATGAGLGSMLYADLLARLLELGMHTAMAVIALPNAASVALHEKFGYRAAGRIAEVGRKQDRWIDVGYWQRMLA